MALIPHGISEAGTDGNGSSDVHLVNHPGGMKAISRGLRSVSDDTPGCVSRAKN